MLSFNAVNKDLQSLVKLGLTNGYWEGIPCLYYNKVGHYIPEIHNKTKIVLHYTAGNILGDFGALTQSRVSVPFLISLSGRLLVLYNPKYWAWHLGASAIGGNTTLSKESIGVEITNWGWLEEKGGILYTYLGVPYCTLADTDRYTKATFRKKHYWANFTEQQYITLRRLLPILCSKFNIPFDYLPEDKRLVQTIDAVTFNGIVTHTNFRREDDKQKKWDIGPAFNWSKLL